MLLKFSQRVLPLQCNIFISTTSLDLISPLLIQQSGNDMAVCVHVSK